MKTGTVARKRVSDLREDLSIYPRNNVDDGHVLEIINAHEAGAAMPPLVAGTTPGNPELRLTDGWHRRRMYQRLYGDDFEVDVEVIEYADEDEMYADAAEREVKGKPFTHQERVSIALRLEKRGFSPERIAEIMITVPGFVEKRLLRRVVKVVDPATGWTDTRPDKPVVRVAAGLPPREITPQMAEVLRGSYGWPTLRQVRQLAAELRSGVILLTPELEAAFADLLAAFAEVQPVTSAAQ